MKSLLNPRDEAEVGERLSRLRPESPRRWGRMSAHQMVCHLCDSFRAAMGEKGASPASGLVQRTVFKWTALYFPYSWPQGVKTRPEMDQEAGGTRPVQFEHDLAELRGLLHRFAQPPRDFVRPPHPIFGEMSERQWRRWGYLHLDHHLRQFGL